MVMRIARFRQLLEVLGPELSRWPGALGDGARELVGADPAAARELETARRLEALLVRHLARDVTAGRQQASEGSGDREAQVMAALQRNLPRQRRHGLTAWLPTALLAFDFAPAWPRVAALVAVAGIGFMIGLSDPSLPGMRGTAAATTDTDLSMIVFEPDPLSGMRPL